MFCRNRAIKIALTLLAPAALVAGAGLAGAQDLSGQNLIKPGEESLTLNIGGIINQFDTKLRVDGQTQRGSDVTLENNGLAKRLSSFDAGGTWRFWSRHRIDVEYFSAKRSGDRRYDGSITIGDDVFPVGATVAAQAEDRFLIADYRYSFLKRDNLELAAGLGFYGGRFDFDLTATGNEALNTRTASTSSSTTVPLPLIGASMDWYINPRWKVSANVQGMRANIGDVDGRVILAGLGTELTLMRNLGLGARYMYTEVDVDVTKTNFNGNVNWRMSSVSVYAKLMF